MAWAAQILYLLDVKSVGFPGSSVAKKKKKKNPPANVRDMGDIGSIPGLRRSPGGGNSNPLQYSCLDNPMDRGACGLQSPWGCKESDTSEPVSMHAKSVPPYVELQLMLKF